MDRLTRERAALVMKLSDFIQRAEAKNSQASLSKDISLADAKVIVSALASLDAPAETLFTHDGVEQPTTKWPDDAQRDALARGLQDPLTRHHKYSRFSCGECGAPPHQNHTRNCFVGQLESDLGATNCGREERAMSDERAPRTDAAYAECVRQGGKYEPFHGPLIEEAEKMERALQAAEERAQRLAKERDGWELGYDHVAELLQKAKQELDRERAARERAESALKPFANEWAIADEAGELQHWPKEEAARCKAAYDALQTMKDQG